MQWWCLRWTNCECCGLWQARQKPTRSLIEVEPELAWDASSMCGTGVISGGAEMTRKLYDGIHSYLAKSGVDGVKVDAQSGIGPFGYGHGGGPNVVRRCGILPDSRQKDSSNG